MYEDIINLPHHVSKKRPQMSMMDRAAQFSPFAALTGYDAAIKETGRLTYDRIDLGVDTLSDLNVKLQYIADHVNDYLNVSFTYFRPDERKTGGHYTETTGIVKRIDDYEHLIVLMDGSKIPMGDVLDIIVLSDAHSDN